MCSRNEQKGTAFKLAWKRYLMQPTLAIFGLCLRQRENNKAQEYAKCLDLLFFFFFLVIQYLTRSLNVVVDSMFMFIVTMM